MEFSSETTCTLWKGLTGSSDALHVADYPTQPLPSPGASQQTTDPKPEQSILKVTPMMMPKFSRKTLSSGF